MPAAEPRSEPRGTKLATSLIGLLACGLLAACLVGPNYHRPTVQTPTAYRDLAADSQIQAQTASYADLPVAAGISGRAVAGTHPHGVEAKLRLAARHRTHQRCPRRARSHSLGLFPQVAGHAMFNGGKESTFQTSRPF